MKTCRPSQKKLKTPSDRTKKAAHPIMSTTTATTPYDIVALQKLYLRLHAHYMPEEETHFTVELIDPEAFYAQLATFAKWIMTEPSSERTQTLAKECDEILTNTHNDTIRGLTDGQTVEGCICMEQYIEQKCQTYRNHLLHTGLTEAQRAASEESLAKWVDRLSRLR